jgi:PAS domain S-box-containing protein
MKPPLQPAVEGKNAEASLRAERLFSDVILSSAPGILYLYDQEGRFLRWNRFFETVSGYSSEEVGRMHLLDFFGGKDKLLMEQRISKVFSEGESFVEAGFLTKAGRSIPYFFAGRRILLDGVACLVGMGIDITGRKQAEEKLRRSESNLANAERIAKIGNWVLDIPNDHLEWSDQTFDILRIPKSEFEASYETFIERIDPRDRQKMEAAQRRALAGTETLDIEHRINLLDGTVKMVRQLGEVIRDAEGKPLRLMGTVLDITDRKKAEEAQLRLAAIVNSSDDAIIGKTLDGIITSWNPGAEKTFGYTSQEAIGQPMLMTFPPERVNEEKELLEKIGRGETVTHFETVRVRKDGRRIDVSVTLSPIINREGKIIGASKIARDITIRKQHELEIERLGRLYSALSFVNQAIVHSTSRQELFQKVCQGLVEKGGFRMAWIGWHDPPSQTLVPAAACGDGDDYLKMIHVPTGNGPEARGPLAASFREHRISISNDLLNDSAALPWRAQLEQRGYRSVAALPIYLEGEVCGTLAVYATEIGFFQNKETALLEEAAKDLSFGLDNFVREQQRQEAQAALSKSEASLASAQSRAQLGNWEIDLRTHAVSWSAEMFRLFGREPSLGEPSFAEVVKIIHPDDRSSFEKIHHQSITERRSHTQHFRVIIPGREFRWIEGRGEVTLDDSGESLRLIGTAQDITERKRAEEEIRSLNATLERRVSERISELEAANKELEAFSYSISHDLRSPLRAINGFAGRVINDFGGSLPEEGKRCLERIRLGGQRMGNLIDDLLAFSRVSRQLMSRTAVNNLKLIQSTLEDLKSQMEGRRIEIKIGNVPPSSGDLSLLRQVWMNLLSNAIKYSRGRAPALIEIGCKAEDGKQVYFVRDNGAGFNMKYANKLFGVFQRLHRASEFDGTGVGLAIVQRIIHRHGGRIWASAEKDHGATFFFTLEGPNHT